MLLPDRGGTPWHAFCPPTSCCAYERCCGRGYDAPSSVSAGTCCWAWLQISGATTAWSALQVIGETWEDFPELKLWGLKRMFKYAVSPVQVSLHKGSPVRQPSATQVHGHDPRLPRTPVPTPPRLLRVAVCRSCQGSAQGGKP